MVRDAPQAALLTMRVYAEQDLILRSPQKAGVSKDGPQALRAKAAYRRSFTPISAELLASWASSAESAAVWAGVPQLGSSLPSPQARGR